MLYTLKAQAALNRHFQPWHAMKINSVCAIPVAIPVKRVGYFTRARRTAAMRTIVKIERDNGVVGVGETRGTAAAGLILARFADVLTGQTVIDAASLRALCLPDRADYGYPDQLVDQSAYAALDMAILDCIGKASGLPLYALLGGKCRAAAGFVAYEYTVDPSEGINPSDVPDRPGLGVTLDMAAVEKYRTDKNP